MIDRLFLALAILSGIWILAMAILGSAFSLNVVTGGTSDKTIWEFFIYSLYLVPSVWGGLPSVFIGYYFYRKHKNLIIFFGVTLLVCIIYLLLTTFLYAFDTPNPWI